MSFLRHARSIGPMGSKTNPAAHRALLSCRNMTARLMLVLCPLTIWAQTPEPKPGATHLKQLEMLVGSWTGQVEAKQNPLGSAAKFTGTTLTELLPGGLGTIARGDTSNGFKWIEIMSYDPVKKLYTVSEWMSDGSFSNGTAVLNGNTINSKSNVVHADGSTHQDIAV
jgi:hypothetical protein